MDLVLNEEQLEYQKLAREFAQKQLTPNAHKFDQSAQTPVDILKGVWESGLFNTQLPDALGGLGLTTFDALLILEELASGCTGIAAAVEANALTALPLLNSADDSQNQRWLKPLVDDFLLAGCATDLYESEPVYHVKAKNTEGGFELSGHIPLVTNGGAASWFVVAAELGERGTLFVVERQSQGVNVEDKPYLLGRRAADLRPVSFANVCVDKSQIIGTEGGGGLVLDQVRPKAYSMLSIACVGLARCGLEHAVRYAKERHTFGQPIANHQGLQFMLADMAKDIEAGRLLAWQSAKLADVAGAEAAYSALVARSFSQNMAMRVATDAVQVYGGYGYSKEYPVEKLMRDAKMYQLSNGTAAKLHVSLGKELLGSYA